MILSLLGTVLVLGVVFAALLVIPSPFRETLRDLVKIRSQRLHKQVTTPIERELELIAGPEKVIEDSNVQVQDLRGTLLHETNMLQLREDGLADAEAAYYKAADDKTDTGLDELAMMVGEREQELALQKGVVDGVQGAVVTAVKAVDRARKELRQVQMTIKSDQAKAKATLALEAAARVMETARSISTTGSALHEASGEVNHDFETARAKLDSLDGSPAERELRQAGERQQVSELRARLDAKRAAQAAPPAKS
jgi:hypothetical protein